MQRAAQFGAVHPPPSVGDPDHRVGDRQSETGSSWRISGPVEPVEELELLLGGDPLVRRPPP